MLEEKNAEKRERLKNEKELIRRRHLPEIESSRKKIEAIQQHIGDYTRSLAEQAKVRLEREREAGSANGRATGDADRAERARAEEEDAGAGEGQAAAHPRRVRLTRKDLKIFNDKFQNVSENLRSLKEKNAKVMSRRGECIEEVKKLKARFDAEEQLLGEAKARLQRTTKEHANKESELTKLQKDLIESKNAKKAKAQRLIALEKEIFKVADDLSMEKKACEKVQRKCKLQDQRRKKVG